MLYLLGIKESQVWNQACWIFLPHSKNMVVIFDGGFFVCFVLFFVFLANPWNDKISLFKWIDWKENRNEIKIDF